MNRIGVIGAGLMGRGVAQSLAQHGLNVVLIDIAQDVLDAARTAIDAALKAAALFDPALRDRGAMLARITTTTDCAALRQADMVIENATEDWSVKAAVYARLAEACSHDCPIAANTSAIPIARLAALVPQPSRVIGMHFMNPVPHKPLVEVIRAPMTSDATVAAAHALLARIGKRGIVVGDSPGFVTNRVLMLTINEAIALVDEGVAPAADVDALFVGCFAHAMGPLATADLIGLDTILRSLIVLQDNFGDGKYAPHPLLRRMVGEGHHGRKSGQGFFAYRGRAAA